MERFPEIEPYEHGMLDVGDGNRVYWEACGNPGGKPALVVHGGPGSGCSFDPRRYRVVLFDRAAAGGARRTRATRPPTWAQTPPTTWSPTWNASASTSGSSASWPTRSASRSACRRSSW